MKSLALALFLALAALCAHAQWHASWIAVPGAPGEEYGVYHFKKDITLDEKPAAFVVYVSADNRYKLFVNDSLVSLGPTRGDTYYWNYETVDLAPFLKQGQNTVSALVWNEGQFRPEAQITLRTSFIVQGATHNAEALNTNESWMCRRDNAYQPLWGFFAASTGEMVDMNKSNGDWTHAARLFGGQLKGSGDGFGYELVPSPLPARDMVYQRIPVVRKAEGITQNAAARMPITIPAHTSIEVLLDQTYLTNAYPTLKFSKGKDAGISLSYAESMFDDPGGHRKPNRNDVDGKFFVGRKDSLVSNGRDNQSYTTLNFRTYRYIRLRVQTKDDPLVIDDLYGTFTGYPFRATAKIQTGDPEIQQMLDIGWRTARLNAFDTYTDCPYYEQLQYIGDTRVQAMISYYYSGDDRLARNAINLMDHSRLPEGVTLSRYPTHSTQIISPFSLWYIGMLHDFWMYRGDSAFIKSKLPGERGVLDFFHKYQKADGSVKDLPYWNFVDWAEGKGWDEGAPPRGADGCSAIIDLQLLWAYQWATQMEARLGSPEMENLYSKRAAQLKQTIKNKYWDATRGLYADEADKSTFSQHAGALALLTGMVPAKDMKAYGEKLLRDASLTQCTIYFRYYLFQALTRAGLGNDYMSWLGVWRNNIKWGLTTWAEYSDPATTRSDCHAWGSSPNIEFFRTVLGIDSDAPGFSRVTVEPRLGTLTNVTGSIPHPQGTIDVSYIEKNGHWAMHVTLPGKVTGTFIWKGKAYPLKAGSNGLTL